METSRGEAKNGWMVELLQNVDLSLEIRHGGSRAAMAVASAAVVFVIVVRRVELLRVDDLDGPPTAHGARHRLHDRAAPELVRHVVVRVYAGQLLRCEVGR